MDRRHDRRRAWPGWGRLLLAGLAWLARPQPALAHAGAPYPVLVDQAVGAYVVSALADPDVGQGTFYVEARPAGGGTLPPDVTVSVAVRPADGHLAEATYTAERGTTRYGDRFVAEVPFDARGEWQVRLIVDGPAGQGEHSFGVQVTPPGISWLSSLACLAPFILLGALWVRSALRRRPQGVAARSDPAAE